MGARRLRIGFRNHSPMQAQLPAARWQCGRGLRVARHWKIRASLAQVRDLERTIGRS